MYVVNSLFRGIGSGDGTQVFRPDSKCHGNMRYVVSPQTGCGFQSFTLDLFAYMCAHLFYLYFCVLIVCVCICGCEEYA